LLSGPLRSTSTWRVRVLAGGAGPDPDDATTSADTTRRPAAVTLSIAGAVALLGAELIERTLFFRACAPRTMPGTHR